MRDRRVFIVSIALTLALGHAAAALTYVVDQRDVTASDQNPGTVLDPLKTISRGAELAQAGDTVLVHAGVYRERVAPARGGTAAGPITYLAAPRETVYIKGSDIWTPQWQPVAGAADCYAAKPDPAMFGTYNPYHMHLVGGGYLTLGQIFVDGRNLTETNRTRCLTLAGSWCRDSLTDSLTVHFPPGTSPALSVVELTTRSRVFAPHLRGLAYITVKGFIIEHGANQNPGAFDAVAANAQSGLLGCRSGNHWLIENNIVRLGKSIGIDIGNEGGLDNEGTNLPSPPGVGYHLIQGNIISDNGCCGICGMSSRSTRIIRNIIERNNALQVDVVENAGFKAHNFNGGVFSQNIVRYNKAYAAWLDSGWPNVRISRNLFYGNTGDAMFLELGSGPAMFDNNVSVYNISSAVYGRDASNVTVVHNLMTRNGTFGVYLQKPDGRTMGSNIGKVYNWKIFNNIIMRNGGTEVRAEKDTGVYNNTQGCNVFTPNKAVMLDTVPMTPTDTLIDSVKVDTAALTVLIAARDTFFRMGCGPFAGLDYDFHGDTMGVAHPLAGPFQDLTPGHGPLSLLNPGVPREPVRALVPRGQAGDRKTAAAAPARRLVAMTERDALFTLPRGVRAAEIYTLRGELVARVAADATGRGRGAMPRAAGAQRILVVKMVN